MTLVTQLVPTFDVFQYDPDEKVLLRDGVECRCDPQACRMLELFLKKPKAVLSRDEMLNDIWDGDIVEEGSIDNCIHRLRKALGDRRHLIETKRGRGYKLAAEVRREKRVLPTRAPLQIVTERDSLGYYVDRAAIAARASEIDMLGWGLFRQWFDHPDFVGVLRRRLRRKKKDLALRIVLPHPDSKLIETLVDDISDFSEKGEDSAQEFEERRQKTIDCATKLPGPDVVRFLETEAVCCGLVRLDDLMIVSLYTYPNRGHEVPNLILNAGPNAKGDLKVESRELFVKLQDMFDLLWNRNEELAE